jgi:hypothetical protein
VSLAFFGSFRLKLRVLSMTSRRSSRFCWFFVIGEPSGGKVVVHSGIFDALGDDDNALAAALFHESAHGYLRTLTAQGGLGRLPTYDFRWPLWMALSGHGSEKVSLSLLTAGVLLFLVLEFGVFFFFYPGAGPIEDLVNDVSIPNRFNQCEILHNSIRFCAYVRWYGSRLACHTRGGKSGRPMSWHCTTWHRRASTLASALNCTRS